MVLKVRSFTKRDGSGRVVEFGTVHSENSARDPRTGKLLLVPHPFYLNKSREVRFVWSGLSDKAWDCAQFNPLAEPNVQRDRNLAASQARARLVGKLHKGDASLGVTFAGLKQSRSMILNRLKQARNLLLRAKSFERTAEFKRDARNFARLPLKDVAKGLADSHLEWIFGWVPLYEDIHSAMLVLAGDLPSDFLRSTGRTTSEYSSPADSMMFTYGLQHKAVWSTQVSVENPNLWLLNRLGLINPAVVAWDLVPWSFVVNLFVNVNSVLRSISDLVGLTLTNGSVTTTSRGLWTSTMPPTKALPKRNSFSSHVVRHTVRSLGAPPRPSLTLRAPELNMDLLLMAGSLVVQQAHRISGKLSRV